MEDILKNMETGYRPTPKDISSAEAMLSPRQEAMTNARASVFAAADVLRDAGMIIKDEELKLAAENAGNSVAATFAPEVSPTPVTQPTVIENASDSQPQEARPVPEALAQVKVAADTETPKAEPLPPIISTSEPVTNTAELAPEIKYDLSGIQKGEEYVVKLHEQLKTLDTQALTDIVEAASQDWGNFNTEKFGFSLPKRLSIQGQNANGETVDLPDALSPSRSLVSNIATELWLRRTEEAANLEKRGMMGANRQNTPELKAQQMHQVEQMANMLFMKPVLDKNRVIGDIQIAIEKRSPGYMRVKSLVDDDAQILSEMLFDKGDLTVDQLRHVAASDDRMKRLIGSLRETLTSPKYAVKIDASIAQFNKVGAVNIDRFGGAFVPTWQENMKKFADANKQFSNSTLPIAP